MRGRSPDDGARRGIRTLAAVSRSAGPHAAPVNARGERPVDVPIYYKVDANPRRWRATGGIRRFPAEFRKTPPGAAHRRQTPDARDVTIATIDARVAQFCHIATVRGRAHAESPPPARRAAWAGERRIGPDDHPGVRPRRQSMQDVMKKDVTPRERRALKRKRTRAAVSRSAGPHAALVNARDERPFVVLPYYKRDAKRRDGMASPFSGRNGASGAD